MTGKAELRRLRAAQRRSMSESARTEARLAICATVLAWCRTHLTQPGIRVAAYEPLRTEPGSLGLLFELHQAGYQVIVPVIRPDRDLDWAAWRPPGQTGPALGRHAVGTSGLILVPAFAADRSGRRLGRGGGSYDRALSRVPQGTAVVALLFDDEVADQVPVDEWDRPVTAFVTPAGWTDVDA